MLLAVGIGVNKTREPKLGLQDTHQKRRVFTRESIVHFSHSTHDTTNTRVHSIIPRPKVRLVESF
jgi:hypothetical protein